MKTDTAMTIRQQVTEFHQAFDQPVLPRPKVPSDERMRLRVRLVAEEFCEMIEAIFPGLGGKVAHLLAQQTADAHVDVDMIELADALADLDYVVEGTRLEVGIKGEPIAAEVHRSNMAKIGGVKRPDGKIQKPDGWTPPNIESELRKQGWGKVVAPWTDDQVTSLNGYQRAGFVHPFTGPEGGDLIATKDGWVEQLGGDVVQTWAHDFMADWKWKNMARVFPVESPDATTDLDGSNR